MKVWLIAAPLCVGALTWAALAQDSQPTRLAPVHAGQQGTHGEDDPARAEEGQWRKQLSQPDLDARMESYEQFKQRLQQEPRLRGMLERFVAEGGELGWTARLMLREVQPSPWRQRARAGFDELERRMQELERNLGDMDRMFGGLRRQNWFEDLEQVFPRLPVDVDMDTQSESMRIQTTPDGVEVEVRTRKDGKEEVQQYKARSMEELYEQHPELRQRAPKLDVRVPSMPPPPSKPRPQGELRTDVLGIYSQKLEPDQASALGLNPEQGLLVDRVEPGTIAQVMGLARGDIIVDINGESVYSVDDVRRILKQRAPAEPLTLQVISEGSKDRRSLTWTPGEPQKADGSMPAPQPKPLRKV